MFHGNRSAGSLWKGSMVYFVRMLFWAFGWPRWDNWFILIKIMTNWSWWDYRKVVYIGAS